MLCISGKLGYKLDIIVGETKPSFQKINTNDFTKKKDTHMSNLFGQSTHLKSFWTIYSSAQAHNPTPCALRSSGKRIPQLIAVLTSSEAGLKAQA